MKHSKLKYSKKMPAFSANFGKMEHPGDGQCSLFDSWTNKVMRLLPHDFTITFDEVKSEIVKHCIDLSKSFDGSKGSDYIAYCAKYAPKSARKAIMKEYERMKKNVSFVNDYDDNGDDSLSDWKVLQSELFDTPAHFDGDACFALDKQA